MNLCKAAVILASMALASTAQAHVRVLPFESQPGAHQTYTVKAPTEGAVATTSVELEVPDGVTIVTIADPAETKKVAGRTVSITWKVCFRSCQSRDKPRNSVESPPALCRWHRPGLDRLAENQEPRLRYENRPRI
jgi:uncharacterized protein YcnI